MKSLSMMQGNCHLALFEFYPITTIIANLCFIVNQFLGFMCPSVLRADMRPLPIFHVLVLSPFLAKYLTHPNIQSHINTKRLEKKTSEFFLKLALDT